MFPESVAAYTRSRTKAPAAVLAAALVAASFAPAARAAADLPEIRITTANQVPACVTPERLMHFLRSRNSNLDPRFKSIAALYKEYGDGWRVRWDYAFYQMAIETNFLTYRRPDGRMGDVDPKQNNFAGIGTTGGGVPGDSFPDVKTGVLAQIQHLVAYSGERIAEPVAPRTRLKQDDIVKSSLELNRPVRFSDLARRWAVDRKYGQSIEWAAEGFRSEYCRGRDAQVPAQPAPQSERAKRPRTAADTTPQIKAGPQRAERPGSPVHTLWSSAAPPAEAGRAPDASATPTAATVAAKPAFDPHRTPPSGLGMPPGECRIRWASYGGTKTLLIRAADAGTTIYTALTVLDGFEKSMAASFIGQHAPGGETVGEYPSQDDAMAQARQLCGQPGPADRKAENR